MDISKRLLEHIFSPVGIMVVLLAVGVLFSFSRRHYNAGRRLLLIGVSLYLIFLFTPLSEILILNLESLYSPLAAPSPGIKIDRIVILSDYGEEHASYPVTGTLSRETVNRLVEGIRLYRLLPGSKLISSGGVMRGGDRPVGALMADFLVKMGIPPADLIVEGSAMNTLQNLANSKAIVGTKPFVLVTTASHMRRAVAVARKLDMQPVPAPASFWTLQHYPTSGSVAEWAATLLRHCTHPSHERLMQLQTAYHEYVGYLWYRLHGLV